MKKLLIFLGIFFSFTINVNAASLCSYKEQVTLNQKAANVKANYEVATITRQFEDAAVDIEVFRISIINMTEDFYVEVSNNIDNTKWDFDYDDTDDGIVSFDWDSEEMTAFTFKVYTSSKTGCPDEVIKTIPLTTPRYNKYSNMAICDDIPEFSLCQRYVTTKEISQEDFLEKVDEYRTGEIDKNGNELNKNQNVLTNVLNFIKEYKWIFVSVLLVCFLIGGYFAVKKIKKIRNQRKMGL